MAVRLPVFLLLSWFAVSSVGRADQVSPPIKVVTYNIRYANPNDGLDVWPNRVDRVAQSIAENDIVGLQEVTFDQLVELRERLSQFEFYGLGRDDGKSGGEHAVILFRRDRFDLLEKGTFWLSESPNKVGVAGWDAALPRTCTWIVLRDQRTSERLWIANTHFDHRGANARVESGKLIRRFVDQQAGVMPVIVMGDFNCVADSDPYRALTAGQSSDPNLLVDARSVSKAPPVGPTSTWNGFTEIVPDRIIDHIFVRGPIEVLELESLNPKTAAGRFASDHLPVRAVVRLQPGAVTQSE